MARTPRKVKDIVFPLADILGELVEKYALSSAQERFLSIRLQFTSDQEASRSCGLSSTTVMQWKGNPPRYIKKLGRYNQFPQAYNELMLKSRAIAEGLMDSMASKVVKRVDELLDATKKIQVGEELMEVPDYESRFKGIQAASHWMDKWSGGQKVEIKNQYVNMQEEFSRLMQRKLKEAQIVDAEVKYIDVGTDTEEVPGTPDAGDDV